MFSFLKKKKSSPKAVVLGLDGVPYSLLMEYMSKGIMPQLSELCSSHGRLMPMRSTLPEISSVAWSSFITGKNPGQHGIFGFMEIDRQSYNYTFPNFQSLKERPVWEREGIKTVAVNIPQTYPAAPMNGVMVSGFVAIDLKKATYPERVYNYLNGIGYRIDVNVRLAQENPEAFFNDIFETFEKRKEAIEYLFNNEEWQLFIGTVTETDRLHHFFFNSSREGKYYPVFERFYSELDSFIGSMAKKAINEGAVFMTCSDHGFTTIDSEVYLNRWLVEKGYLSLNGTDGLQGIAPESRAFCLDPSRIYIHTEGRYGRGSVKRGDYEKVRAGLKEELNSLEFDGHKVIKEVYFKEEIFKGALTENGPDIYLLPNYGFDLKGAVNRDKVFGTSHFKGMHTYDDAHLFSTVPVNRDGIKIEDIAEIICSSLRSNSGKS